jgi:hypothetical protein
MTCFPVHNGSGFKIAGIGSYPGNNYYDEFLPSLC